MRKLLFGTVALLILDSPAVSYANLLTDGSFENTTNFSNTGNDTMILQPGNSTAMPGWTVVGTGNAELAWIGPSNPYGIPLMASDGSYFLDLTGYNNGAPYGGVEQTIATTVGTTYRLSFDQGDDQGDNGGFTESAITASAAGSAQTFFSSTSGWTTQTLNFTATGSTTTISLTGAQGWSYIGLDNVVVTGTGSNTVPEPASVALLGVGVAGLGTLRRRRRIR
jgi:hypothetical protein